ncbi:para-aminobenzoate synthase component I [Neoasaia chiangmaiensis NBRC 101099]|uniref:Uncharacterized protein n=1 Tax=Neoasaia chiangmaiensis TaxID=320497 RepID=A0A1U9KRU5_9PROT|nr:anthranilate synthase component I family protein [Neoasaia chiangmaiensis]AQS88546.1 hypothetical protein A0U93_12035 [Neoasaia chiangmaiensis]GBR36337.1 para-aminobenzoate synthase component I [Neoasaia chiangmaiensis NBRC 101099]GEN15380.1 para-aminobenzoate synthase [Neoasaia chiangmaiensis]
MNIVEQPWRTPDAFLAEWADEPWLAMLDSGGPITERARWTVLCRRPRSTLVASGADAWSRLRALMPPRQPSGPLPFQAGVIGAASYGAGLRLENVPSRHVDPTPEIVAAFYENALVFDRQDKRLWWSSLHDAPPPDLPGCTRKAVLPPSVAFAPDQTASAWQQSVRTVIDAIAAGDIFQANLTQRWRARRPAALNLVDLYRHLRKTAPAPFGGMLISPEYALLGSSVERFLQLSATGRIETRPIKGTAPLGRNPEDDRRIAAALARDDKEYAENLMITDLMRNDIGRVCATGSVEVPELCVVERFAHWHHLVSSVRGRLKPGLDAIDLLCATLPPGSVTGAPKHRAMSIIDTVETSARDIYCGSMFRLGVDGAMDSNVVIRSLGISRDDMTLGAGGGITYPSDPKREYDEMLLKAAPLLGMFRA